MKRLVTVSLGAAFLGMAMMPGKAVADGAQIFKDKNCTECHYTQGPAQEKTIADKLAMKGPELWYAGDKFQKKWLHGWLADPQPIRPLKFNTMSEKNPGNHPKLAKGEAEAVSGFLMGLKSGEVKSGVIKPKKNAKGKRIFLKKMPCNGCHLYPDRKKRIKGGLSGPTLVGAGKRLNPDWIYAYLTNPKVFKPVKMMPVFTGLIKDKDMKKVSAFVANFK